MLSLLTLNVQATALPRAKRLLAWLDTRDDDLVILTETSNGAGTAHLLNQCRAAGLSVACSPSTDGDRGAVIVSRLPMTARPDLTPTITLPGRAVAVTLDTEPVVTVLGLYVPSSDRAPDKVTKKRAFLTSVLDDLRSAPDPQRAHLVIGGDYNVVTRDHQPPYRGFLPFEYDFLDALPLIGLTDAHQHLHPGVQAHSWLGRAGNPYRFDYFHTGTAITPHLTGCDYLHEPRELGLTDHAGVALTIQARPRRAAPSRPSLTGAGALF